jgi:hypothetical protein
MKVLTGELDAAEGHRGAPEARRRLSQDQFAFDAFRVVDTVIMGNRPLWLALAERDELYAKEDMTDEDGMRSANWKAWSPKTTATRPRAMRRFCSTVWIFPRSLHDRKMSELQGGQKCACCWRRRCSAARSAAARRADEPPRSGIHPLAAGFPDALPGHADRHFARSALPEQRLHAYRRYRLSDDHHVHRRL